MKRLMISIGLTFAVAFVVQAATPSIVHTPIPIAFRGQSIPILARVADADGDLAQVTLKYAQDQVSKPMSASMAKMGKSMYRGFIPMKWVKSAKTIVYHIEAKDKADHVKKTIKYPIKVKDAKKVKSKKKPSKTTKFIKKHPVVTTVGGVVVAGGVTAAVVGGGGGGGGGGSSPFTGTWNVSDGYDTYAMQLTQNGSTVTGSIASSPSGPATISGTISGDTVTLNITWTNYSSTDIFTGTLSADKMSMSGTYTYYGGGNSYPWSASKI